jgi:cellulose synthase (UDP-forming)
MMDNLAWGLNLAVLGFFWTVVPFLPKERTWARSLVIAVTLALWVRYLVWRVTSTAPSEFTLGTGLYFGFGLAVELVIFLPMVLFFVTLSRIANRSREADRQERWLRSLPPEQLPRVDVFLPTYNEDRVLVERGIVAAKALDYPRFKVWVLDDGRRDWLRELCKERDVGYIRRTDNRGAKAGNINHALSITNGELFVVFDADFTPMRNFLYRTVGFFFADSRVTIVQTPQHFFNPDVFQINMGLSEVMQDNEREWFDVILSCRDAWDCAFCCGTSAVFRRDAIRAIGGIATESVTEDILTTVKMLPKGYITRYLNERLSMGLSPENVQRLLIQRRRWTRGHIQMLYLLLRKFGARLTFFQWLMFIPFHYLLDFPCRLLFALLPLIYLWTGYTHFYVNSTAELVAYQGPALLSVFLLGRWFMPHARVPLISSAESFYLSGRTFPTVVGSLLKPFGVPFLVTPKGKATGSEDSDPAALWALAVLLTMTIGGIIVGCRSPWGFYSPAGLMIATCWALCNLVLFGLTLLAVSRRPRPRGEERFVIDRPILIAAKGQMQRCTAINVSLTGVLIGGAEDLDVGESVQLQLDGVGDLPGTVVRKPGSRVGIHFNDMPVLVRDRLILYLYSEGLTNEVQEINPFLVLWRLLKGAILGPA